MGMGISTLDGMNEQQGRNYGMGWMNGKYEWMKNEWMIDKDWMDG